MERISARELPRLLLDHAPRLRRYIDQRLPATVRALVAADDILQETWIAALRGIDSFRVDAPDALQRWLTQIARNKLADAMRAAGSLKRGGGLRAVVDRSSSLTTLLQRVMVDSATPSRLVSGQQRIDALTVALCQLPEPAQRAIRLHYMDALSHAEIAAQLRISPSSVNSLLFRALRRLRSLLVSLSGDTRIAHPE